MAGYSISLHIRKNIILIITFYLSFNNAFMMPMRAVRIFHQKFAHRTNSAEYNQTLQTLQTNTILHPKLSNPRNLPIRSNIFTEAIKINSILALAGITFKQPFLTDNGLITSWLLGILLWTTLGLQGWSICAIYFIFGSIVTKIGFKYKEKLNIAEPRQGRRGMENVLGSATVAALCCLLSAIYYKSASIFNIGYVASLATKLSDTFASEIGKVFGKNTYSITTFKPVPPGTEGAVSLEGTLAGIAGSFLLTIYAIKINFVNINALLPCTIAAFTATNIESIIGSTLQKSKGALSVASSFILTNEVVNFINTFIGAVIAILLY